MWPLDWLERRRESKRRDAAPAGSASGPHSPGSTYAADDASATAHSTHALVVSDLSQAGASAASSVSSGFDAGSLPCDAGGGGCD